MASVEVLTSKSPRSERAWLRDLPVAIVVGVVAAWVGAAAAGMPMRWTVYIVAAILFGAAVLLVSDRERFLSALFVLSLQVNGAYRIGFGHAGSSGLAFPFCAVMAAGFALWLLASGRLRAQGTVRWAGSLAWPIAGLLGMSILSLAVSSERFVGLAQLLYDLQLYLVFWVGLNMIRTEADLDRVVRLLLLTLACQAIIYFVQSALSITFTGEGTIIPLGEKTPRPGGTVSTNPAGFASFVIPLLCLALARIGIEERRWRKAYLAALGIMGVAAVGLTFTRAAWGGLVLALGWLFVLGIRRGMVRARWVAPVAVVAVLTAAILAPQMAARRTNEFGYDSAFESRWGLMRIALNVIRSHPVFGVGPGAYDQAFKGYVPAGLSDQWLYTVHNEFLLRASEIGVIGGLAFAALVIGGIRQTTRLSAAASPIVRATGLGCSAGLVYLAWQMCWVPWRGFEYNALFWLVLAIAEASARLPGAQPGYGTGSTESSVGAAGPADPEYSSAPRSGALPLHGT